MNHEGHEDCELRDHAMVAMLIRCGLRHAELLGLSIASPRNPDRL